MQVFLLRDRAQWRVDTVILRTHELPSSLVAGLRKLLNDAFEGRFSDEDWRHCVGGWHVLLLDGQAPISHAAVVRRVLQVGRVPLQCGYVEAVATTPAQQRKGLGGTVMGHVSALLNGEVEMGALSTSKQHFYERLGWERWLGPTFVRRGPRLVRTSEEDDGIMVLRFGASRDVDRTAPLSCEARRGDDW